MQSPKRSTTATKIRRKTRWWGPFRHTWTTIGHTIYAPADCYDPLDDYVSLEHELVHVEQWNRYGIWFWISYLFLPIPFGLAWFRWRWEREAYSTELIYWWTPEQIVDVLASRTYLWPWPKKKMLAWFQKEHKL